jgi:transcriptional regulator with XRE-family HTH domain
MTVPTLDSNAAALLRTKPATRHVSTFIDFWLGQQLRELRKDKGLSLQELSDASGVSVGTLSHVERGLTSASVKTLSRISRSLGVSINNLLGNIEQAPDHDDSGWVARANTHKILQMKDKKIVKEIITPSRAQAMDLYRVRIQPGGSTGDELFFTDGGEVAGTVITGCMELWIENRLVLLNAGDSFCYPSQTPRKWSNPGDVETYVIWAIARAKP